MPSKQGEARAANGALISSDADAARERTAHALEMLALPARLFAPSAAAREVFERNGVPSGRIRVLENGVDVTGLAARVESERPAQVSRDGKIRIGVLGSAQPSKGVLEFARAALSLDEPRLRIEVHGALPDYHGDSSYVVALRELAARDARLQLCGAFAHMDQARILARLDALAAPSIWNEVFGLSAREARAAGLFVFASDRGGLAGMRGDVGVRLLPAGDANAWSAALALFVRDQLASGARRNWPAPGNLRSVHELALELEQHYVELVRTQLGREPALVFEPGSDRASARASGVSSSLALAPTPRANWWRRLWR